MNNHLLWIYLYGQKDWKCIYTLFFYPFPLLIQLISQEKHSKSLPYFHIHLWSGKSVKFLFFLVYIILGIV